MEREGSEGFHWNLETCSTTSRKHTSQVFPLNVSNKLVNPISKVEHQKNTSIPILFSGLNRLAEVAYVTYLHYYDHWNNTPSATFKNKPIYDRNFYWIGKEEPFTVHHRLPNGVEIKLRGKMDGVFKYDKGGRTRLFETKTKSNIDVGGLQEGLKKDMQTGLYLYALFLQTGKVPSGFLYNVIRRPNLRPT